MIEDDEPPLERPAIVDLAAAEWTERFWYQSAAVAKVAEYCRIRSRR